MWFESELRTEDELLKLYQGLGAFYQLLLQYRGECCSQSYSCGLLASLCLLPSTAMVKTISVSLMEAECLASAWLCLELS